MKTHLPMLQVALDNLSMAAAYNTTRLIAAEVDFHFHDHGTALSATAHRQDSYRHNLHSY